MSSSGPGGAPALRVRRVRKGGASKKKTPLPLLLSWAHSNLLQAMDQDPDMDEHHPFEDNIFKRQLAGCRGSALTPDGSLMYVSVKDGHAIWQVRRNVPRCRRAVSVHFRQCNGC